MDLSVSSSSSGLGRAAVCDCGTPWTFLLPFLPAHWKIKINQNNFVCKNIKQYVARNCYLKLLCKDKKGSRTFYDIIVGNQDSSPPSQKWVNILENISQEKWDSYIKEVKLQEFQFKVNNHILVTKSFLHKINKVDNDRCALCGLETETIIHVLFNYNKVKEFWLAMKNWLRIQANVTLHLTIRNVIFSKQENGELLNYILLLGKYFIYKTKFLANSIRLENFIELLVLSGWAFPPSDKYGNIYKTEKRQTLTLDSKNG